MTKTNISFPKLKFLKLKSIHLENEFLEIICPRAPELEALNIANNSSITRLSKGKKEEIFEKKESRSEPKKEEWRLKKGKLIFEKNRKKGKKSTASLLFIPFLSPSDSPFRVDSFFF